MKPTTTPALIGLCLAFLASPAFAQKKADIDKLHALVQQARAQVKVLREVAGISLERREGRGEHGEGRREGRGEHGEERRERRGEHGERRREGRGEHEAGRREGRGEHSEGRGGEGEESGKRIAKNQTWDATRNGAHLILAYDADSQSFKGTVENASTRLLSQVRVEVHLSNGVELGPTRRIDLEPGKKITVELSAADQSFEWWTTHPESGTEEGHGSGHEGEAGERGGNRPEAGSLRPLYNELLLLNREIKAISEVLRRRGRQERRR